MSLFRSKQPGRAKHCLRQPPRNLAGFGLVKAELVIVLLSLVMFSENTVALDVVRGPYLQMQTSNSVIIRWRTDVATNSVVHFGLSPSQLNNTFKVTGSTTQRA